MQCYLDVQYIMKTFGESPFRIKFLCKELNIVGFIPRRHEKFSQVII